MQIALGIGMGSPLGLLERHLLQMLEINSFAARKKLNYERKIVLRSSLIQEQSIVQVYKFLIMRSQLLENQNFKLSSNFFWKNVPRSWFPLVLESREGKKVPPSEKKGQYLLMRADLAWKWWKTWEFASRSACGVGFWLCFLIACRVRSPWVMRIWIVLLELSSTKKSFSWATHFITLFLWYILAQNSGVKVTGLYHAYRL